MNRKLFTLIALIALLPAALQAQTADERIDGAMLRAQAAGIPVSLLESKILEGRAKGVPMDRIAAAVEQRGGALSRAQEAMTRGDRELSAADLSAGADALDSGISEAVLQTISEKAPQDRRAVAITALTNLVVQGHVPQDALDRVVDALERGPEALASLPGQAAEARERAGAPSSIPGAPAGAGAPGAGQAGPPAGVPTPGEPPASGRPGGTGRPPGGN